MSTIKTFSDEERVKLPALVLPILEGEESPGRLVKLPVLFLEE